MNDEMHVILIEMGGADADDGLGVILGQLSVMAMMGRLERVAVAARGVHNWSRNAVRQHPTTEGLLGWCRHMLADPEAPKDKLTPEVMAERVRKIAALPRHAEVTDDGSMFAVDLMSDDVWSEIPLPDDFKAGLAKAKLANSGTANRRPV